MAANKTCCSTKLADIKCRGNIIPICDLALKNYSEEEQHLRCKLAACYRLVDMAGWSDGIWNHITVRIRDDEEDSILLNPLGLLYDEITASSLVKVDLKGNIKDPGSTKLGVNKTGFMIHSAIHEGRPDISAIIHIHTTPATVVSCMKEGLLPISQDAIFPNTGISYHNLQGWVVDQTEKDDLVRNLGPQNMIMFMRNHGVLVCGTTVEEAFDTLYKLMKACDVQVHMAAIGLEKAVLIDEDVKKCLVKHATEGVDGLNMESPTGIKWGPGELEFEAEMRKLDRAGYQTGYKYRQSIETSK